jgi:hypothetical protein
MSDSSIFSQGRSSAFQPVRIGEPAAPRACAGVIQTSTTIATGHDARLLAILEDDAHTGEPAFVRFGRKEQQLAEAFAALPVLDQRALHTRLSKVREGDLLADRFSRMAVDRKTRLLNFLADARRRAAQAAAQKVR